MPRFGRGLEYVHMNVYRIRSAFLRRRSRRPKPHQLELDFVSRSRRVKARREPKRLELELPQTGVGERKLLFPLL